MKYLKSYVLTDERRKEIREQQLIVNPHVHSYYSLLDGATTPEELVKYTLELGQPAACISDHGVMYSLVDFINLCEKHKQKYLIAMEAYVVTNHLVKTKLESDKEAGNGREHLLLVAINETGYRNLMRMASVAATEGFYHRPRIDDDLLKKYNEGIIATSACLGSRFSQLIVRNDLEGCKRELKKYTSMFKGRFYLEIQPTKEYLQKIVNHAMIKLAKELDIPLLATTDAHYLRRQHSRTHDVLLTMQSNNVLSNPLRWQFPGDTFFVASRKEMVDMFFEDCESELDDKLAGRPEEEWKMDSEDHVFERPITYWDEKKSTNVTVMKKYITFKHNLSLEDIEDAIDNTVEIADRNELEIKFDKTYLPKVDIKGNPEFEEWHKKRGSGKLEENYLRYLCIKGLKEKKLTSQMYRDRLDYELSVINGMGFPDYFLLLEDVITWCRENDIPVGPGRGCFTPGQKVTTLEHGLINIEKVVQGDHVLTHRKVYKPVKGVQTYNIKENVVKLYFRDQNGIEGSIKATEDHEIFVIPKEMGSDFKCAKWMSIKDIRKGDIVLKPVAKDHPDHFHKNDHENCVHCNGKPVSEEYDEMMRQYHETAMNTTRVIEKTLSTLKDKADDKVDLLNNIQTNFEQIRDSFGFDLTIERTFEEASEELEHLGYKAAEVWSTEYVHYDGPVYDLSVEGVTSYTINGIAVHNSAAGSLVSYAIGITNVDPIQYGLLFERFLNPSRGKLPDIDVDFCIKNRGRVMNYIMERYGREHVANIATFGRLQTKLVIKDVAKAMGIEYEEVNNFTKLLPSGPGSSIHINDIVNIPECRPFVNKYPDLFEHAANLEGSPRHVSQHAAGMVVSPPEYPLWSLIPLQRGKEVVEGVEAGYLTQLEKEPVEKLGLVKMDILGLKNVTELHEQFKMVETLYGIKIDFNSIPMDDEKTWDLIGKGHTLGVFQFASNLAINVVTKIKPRNIEELSAANSFIRPGSSGLDEYLEAKLDQRKIRKLHPKLDVITDVTYGAIVYQEQIMGLIAAVMDIDFGEADIYRRYLEKPDKNAEKVAKWKEEFIQLGLKHGFDRKLIDLLVQLIIENCGYGFNKSHAVAYSIIGYWTAYMKANYPLVFYMTLLNGNLDEADSFIAESRQLGIEVLPPHVNTSDLNFTIEDNSKIRAGFNAVKGIGPKAVDTIRECQPFKSIDDFTERVGKAANKKVWEALIKFGSFDDLGIEIEPDDISSKAVNIGITTKEIEGETITLATLNRKQMAYWYDRIQEESNRKAPANYLVPTELIPGKYLGNDAYELVEEKDGGIVIPEDQLTMFGLDINRVETTRKRPKGMFARVSAKSSVPPSRRVLQLYSEEISKIQPTYLETYLEESEELGFSFLTHPLESHLDKINLYDDIEDGGIMTTAGIIESITKRMTKTNKPFYWVVVKSPRDRVRVTVWDNQLKEHAKLIQKHGLVAVRGTKGFGGISLDMIKAVKI